MALYFATGFENGYVGVAPTLSNPDTEYWGASGGSPEVSSSIYASGGYSLRINSSGVEWVALHMDGASRRRLVGQLKFRYTTVPDSDCDLFSIDGVTTENIASVYVAGGVLRGGLIAGLVNQSWGSISTGVWYLLDFDIDISTSTLKLNGRVNGNAKTQVSTSGTAQDIEYFYLGTVTSYHSSEDFYIDDVLLSTTGTDYPLDEMYVLGYSPTSDGTHSPNPPTSTFADSSSVDISGGNPAYDNLTDFSTTNYVKQYGGTSSNYVRVGFDDAPSGKDPVAVQVVVGQASAAASASNMESDLWDGTTLGSIWTGSSSLGTTLYTKWRMFTQTPSSTAWTETNFNSIQYQAGRSSDYDPNPWFCAVMLEAAYISGGSTTYTKSTNIEALVSKSLIKSSTVLSVVNAPTRLWVDDISIDPDDWVGRWGLLTHSVDSSLYSAAAEGTISYNLDALIKSTITASHDLDALIAISVTTTHDLDALIAISVTTTHDFDALIATSVTTAHDLDALIATSVTTAHDLDALILKTINTTIETTQSTFYGKTEDGYITSQGVDSYSTTRTGNDLFSQNSSVNFIVGQYSSDNDPGTVYNIEEGFVAWDTSTIGSDEITEATVSLFVESGLDVSDNDFVVELKSKSWLTTLTTADWVAGEDLGSLGNLLASTNTSGKSDNVYWDFTSETDILSAINKTGNTEFIVYSDQTRLGSPPPGFSWELVYFTSANQSSNKPKLVVTHGPVVPFANVVDSLIHKTNTIISSIDALIAATVTTTHDLDTLISKLVTTSSDVDALISISSTKYSDVDSLISRLDTKIYYLVSEIVSGAQTLSQTHEIDSLISKTQITSSDVDARIASEYMALSDIDSLLSKSGISVTSSMNASILDTVEAVSSIDSLIEQTVISENLVDALISKALSAESLIDSLISKSLKSTCDIDSLINKTELKVHSIDSLIEKSYTIDSDIDSLIMKYESVSSDVDANIEGAAQIYSQADSLISKTQLQSHQIASLASKSYSEESSLDVLISKAETTSTDIDSLLTKAQIVESAVDVAVGQAGQLFSEIDSLLSKSGNKVQYQIDCLIAITSEETTNIDSLLLASLKASSNIDVLVSQTDTATSSVDSLVLKSDSVESSVDSQIASAVSVDSSIDSLLSSVEAVETYLVAEIEEYLIVLPDGDVSNQNWTTEWGETSNLYLSIQDGVDL